MNDNEGQPGWVVVSYLKSPVARNARILEVFEVKLVFIGLEQPDEHEIERVLEGHMPGNEILVSVSEVLIIPPLG